MIPAKALFIQLKMLGDIMMLTPAIRAFKEKFPDAIIDVAVESPGDDLIRFNPAVNNAVLFDQRHWYSIIKQYKTLKKIRHSEYDIVIDFLGNPRSAHYTFLSGAKIRVGYSDARFQYAYNKTYERTHCFSALSKLKFLEFLGIDSTDIRLEFNVDPDYRLPESVRLPSENLIAISPVSIVEHKIWPTENFAKIAEYLHSEFGLYPIVIVGPGERGFLDEFGKHSRTPYLPVYADSIMLLGSVLKKCRLFLGNDNGPKHIAVALGLPTYTIYGDKSDPVCWEYPDLSRHRFIGGMNRQDQRPIKNISPDDVILEVGEFIAEIGITDSNNVSIKKENKNR